MPLVSSSANSIASPSSGGVRSLPSRARSVATSSCARWMKAIMTSRLRAMLGMVRSAGSRGAALAPLGAFFLPLPQRPGPLELPLGAGAASGVEVLSPFAAAEAACSSPLLVWLLLARFLLCGLEAAAEVGPSPRCLVYWLLPRRLTLRPAPFLWETFSCVAGGGLSGCEEGGGEVCEVGLGLGVSSGSSGGCQLLFLWRSKRRIASLTILSSSPCSRLPAPSGFSSSSFSFGFPFSLFGLSSGHSSLGLRFLRATIGGASVDFFIRLVFVCSIP